MKVLIVGGRSGSFTDKQTGEAVNYAKITALQPSVGNGQAGYEAVEMAGPSHVVKGIVADLAEKGPGLYELDVTMKKVGNSSKVVLLAAKLISNKFNIGAGGIAEAK